MKQVLVPKPDITVKGKFNHTKEESLQILSCSNDELRIYLLEQMHQNPYLNITTINETDSDAFLQYHHQKRSLYDEIIEQVHLYSEPLDISICEYLIFQLDSNGYFKVSRDDLLKQSAYSSSAIQYHLTILHTFEPLGAFAFDLKDCLQIQCTQSEQAASETAYDLCAYLEDLALQHFDQARKDLDISMEELWEGFHFIQSLNPKPAANYATETVYMNSEFKIEVQDLNIHIELQNDDLEITFQADNDSSQSKEIALYMRKQRAQVQNIINSIQKRNMTLLQIMQYICDIQKDYFLYHSPLKHLTLSMIAQNCGLHISTISRAIMNKSFEFEHRYTPLRKMLSNGGSRTNSQDDIKKAIITIIELENKEHPYSDEAICTLLKDRGIQISRRAVAKYRDACFIYNSSKRKKSIQKNI